MGIAAKFRIDPIDTSDGLETGRLVSPVLRIAQQSRLKEKTNCTFVVRRVRAIPVRLGRGDPLPGDSESSV